VGLRKRADKMAVLAEHGRWISIFRDDIKLLEQRLRGLERRLSVAEHNLAELRGAYGKPDLLTSRPSGTPRREKDEL